MWLRKLDATIFAVQPWAADAGQTCATLRARLTTATKVVKDESPQAILRGYQSIVCALTGINIAQDGRYQQADFWLTRAYELAQDARFTRGWSSKERQLAVGIDYALTLYLSGEETSAVGMLRNSEYDDHIIANFMTARMLIEKGNTTQVKQGLGFLEEPDNIDRLSLYSEELAQTASKIVLTARKHRSFPTNLRVKPRSLGWWVGKQGWQGRG